MSFADRLALALAQLSLMDRMRDEQDQHCHELLSLFKGHRVVLRHPPGRLADEHSIHISLEHPYRLRYVSPLQRVKSGHLCVEDPVKVRARQLQDRCRKATGSRRSH